MRLGVFLYISCLIALSVCFLKIQSKTQLGRLFDIFPEKPALVVYESSTQIIQDNEAIYQKLHQDTRDFCLVLVIDCQKNIEREKKDVFEGCPNIVREKRNLVAIEGYIPNNNLLSVRGKMFRMVPGYIQNEVERSYQSFINIVQSLIPNYIEKLYSENDIKSFLERESYLVPRALLYTDSEDYPSIRKLSVYLNGRAKFAQVAVKQYSETKLVVYEFDFAGKTWNNHTFPSKISGKNYENMKQFIQTYAPNNPIRQEYQYLRIEASRIQYANLNNYTKVLYNSLEKYSIVFKGQNRQLGEKTLQMYRQKYGDYIYYILLQGVNANTLHLVSNQTQYLPLDKAQLSRFPVYHFSDVENNAQNLMDLGNVVLLVEPELDYLCSIQNLRVVSGFLNCYPIHQDDVSTVKQKFNIPQNDQMAILFSTNVNGSFVGKNFNNHTFQNVVSIIYNVVRQRIKAIAKKFSSNPIFPIPERVSYAKMCESCFIYLHSKELSFVTMEDYKKQALEHNKEFPFYHGFYDCHIKLFQFIKKQPQDMLIFINKGKLFSVKEGSKQIAGKVIKRWKEGALKMKQIPKEILSDQKCAHNERLISEEENDEL